MRTSIRLKDLAFMAGVSVSTASKALKNRRDVSLITKNKIKDLAIAYDYIPNNAALSLQSRKTNTIAVIVPEINNLVYLNFQISEDYDENIIKEIFFNVNYGRACDENLLVNLIEETIKGF